MRIAKLSFLAGFVLAPLLAAQTTPKALTNADVTKMVQAGLSEPVIVATIQANPGSYDISPDSLIALHKAGITDAEVNAIVAVASGAAAPGAAPAAAPSPSPARFQMPAVSVTQNGATQELPLEKTQLANTKTKPTSMASLAGDSAVTQAIQAGVGDATSTAAAHMGSATGSAAMQQAGTIFGGIMAHRKPAVTYVWGVPNVASANVLQVVSPEFSVNFARAPGINPDDFEPAIVKLTPAQNTCRIVGATQGKDDAGSSATADWPVYQSFLEERVPANAQKIQTGQYKLSPAAPLIPGEYAIVLRPISKSKRFAGGDVARAQGDGLMFDAVWSFQIAVSAQ